MSVLVVRLVPITPTDAATFTGTLAGLRIEIFDLTVGDPKTGTLLGVADTVAPAAGATVTIGTGAIVQHYVDLDGTPLLESVADAVIPMPAQAVEYPKPGSPDLRLAITRTTAMGEVLAIADAVIEFNVVPAELAVNPGGQPQSDIFDLPPSCYVALPPAGIGAGAGLADIPLNADGTPPAFETVRDAVDLVLKADPTGVTLATVGPLTAAQAAQIAGEMVWNRVADPQPATDPDPLALSLLGGGYVAPAPNFLGAMYTKGLGLPGLDTDGADRARMQFEGNLAAYRARLQAKAGQIATFVYAAAAAVDCEKLTAASVPGAPDAVTAATITVPILAGQTDPSLVSHVAVTVASGGGEPAFLVPAAFFYALGCTLPAQINPSQRLAMARTQSEAALLTAFQTAVDTGVIQPTEAATASGGPALDTAQVARRLAAIGADAAAPSPIALPPLEAAVVTNWLAYAGPSATIDTAFWAGEVASHAAAYASLVLRMLTGNLPALITAIQAPPLGATSVGVLAAVTDAQWRDFFLTTLPAPPLPAFTAPGTRAERVDAFINRVRTFFAASGVAAAPPVPAPSPIPLLPLSPGDVLARFAAFYATHAGVALSFAAPLDPVALDAALGETFPDDVAAQDWLSQRLGAIDALVQLTDIGAPALQFSLIEALYARGFTDAARVAALSLQEFQHALEGTVATPHASAIHAKAGPGPFETTSPETFVPINPDGRLVDCVPPCHLSPLGPVAYLAELMRVTTTGTCAQPGGGGGPSLGTLVAARRGDLWALHATGANADRRIPAIDLVNESLEALASSPGTSAGAVFDTRDEEDAALRLRTVPEWSTPATPVANPAGYGVLKADFSAPLLPYDQPLDITRANLELMGTSRYEVMRLFRRRITEFAIDPAHEPADFRSTLWRYPVRFEIALEALGLSGEEYLLLFAQNAVAAPTPGKLALRELYGFAADTVGGTDWHQVVLEVPEFLARTGLDYCAFLELQRCGYVPFVRQGEPADFPDCLPCCPESLRIQFLSGTADAGLAQLAVFIRLWRRLGESRQGGLSFALLAAVCRTLALFSAAGDINTDFLRQLAALLILCDLLRIRPDAALLALWQPPGGPGWTEALARLLDRLEDLARRRHGCASRGPDLIKLIAANLDVLSRLAGFDPSMPTETWHAKPAATLRFVEILAKIYASDFTVGELVFIVTASDHLDGDDPFAMQPVNEALDRPFELPDDGGEHTLWSLRGRLLDVEVEDDAARGWTWPRIEADLRDTFGLAAGPGPDPLLDLGRHFFQAVVSPGGGGADARWRVPLPLAETSPLMWNTPVESPFRYDTASQELWCVLPLDDASVCALLSHLRPLGTAERKAVQDLYFAPRLTLAPFAFLFDAFEQEAAALVSGADDHARFGLFQRIYARFRARCGIIVRHLARHVADLTATHARPDLHQESAEAEANAWLILRTLHADENFALTPWESPDGKPPALAWGPGPAGGAFAALLGLTGTGLVGTYTPHGGAAPVWRDLRGPLIAFGPERNAWNAPVPTVIPAMDLALSAAQRRFAAVRNGFAMRDSDGEPLGGAERFTVQWDGLLLVEHGGSYRFHAGAPRPGAEEPDFQAAEAYRWRLTLTRGQRSWILLNHRWPGEDAPAAASHPLQLRDGVYGIVIEFDQRQPTFGEEEAVHPRRAGFEIKYCGADTDGTLAALPMRRLYQPFKTGRLGEGIVKPDEAPGAAHALLQTLYTSSVRDIRRTYQRAVKAVLLTRRFGLSAIRRGERQTELGYLLDHPEAFSGATVKRTGPALYAMHLAWFDLDFLPVADSDWPPAGDARAAPSPERQAALFDWFERLFDDTAMRRMTRPARERPAWLLFYEADERQPDEPAQLLRHLGIDIEHVPLLLRLFEEPAPYTITTADLIDERWPVRIWHAELWLRRLLDRFVPQAIGAAQPYLWAADDPGTANLTAFVQDGSYRNGEPRRYRALERVNDGLRERGRAALLAYLCGMNRVAVPWAPGAFATSASDLTALLLQDVCAGLAQEATRVEDAIGAILTFVTRARLGLEADFAVTGGFSALWDSRFATFHIWQACRRRELYRENWIGWEDLKAAQKVEAFRFLDDELRRSALTIAAPGGMEWWPAAHVPAHPSLTLLQDREPARLALRAPAPLPEGLDLIGSSERDARPAWLAPVLRRLGRDPSPPPRGQGGDTPPRGRGNDGPSVRMRETDTGPVDPGLPFWIRAAVRLGSRYLRIAAAGLPPASAHFTPTEPQALCCCDCDAIAPAAMDEYYFWLADTRWFDAVTQDADAGAGGEAASFWHRPDNLPTMLDWPSRAGVRLAWCRVHHGDFDPPRWSSETLAVDTEATGAAGPQLDLVGRFGDSLRFAVSHGVAPAGMATAPAPGFRYDLATDDATVLPLVASTPDPAPSIGGLAAYPYFAFFAPGAPVEPLSLFAVGSAVAARLRTHCRFDAALHWYALAYAPLKGDNQWAQCLAVAVTPDRGRTAGATRQPRVDGTCCPTLAPTAEAARRRAVTLDWLETALAWVDAKLCSGSPEASREAEAVAGAMRGLLGASPVRIAASAPAPAPTLRAFAPAEAPLNPRLIALYEHLADRLCLIRDRMNGHRLRRQDGAAACCDPGAWGDETVRDGWRETASACVEAETWCLCGCSPYRFTSKLQNALQLAEIVRQYGTALLSAFEKGDAEFLAGLRAAQERQVLDLGTDDRKNAWREADWQVQALQKTKQGAQERLRYYQNLIADGLNTGEIAFEALTGVSTASRLAANVVEAVAQGIGLTPDMWFGVAGIAGTPLFFQQWPIGNKLAANFTTAARILNTVADIANSNAGLSLTEAGWDRREAEWRQQVAVITIEIDQIERQILAAERRRAMALRGLNTLQQQREAAADTQAFLRDKFTGHQLYLYLQQESAALHRQAWELAMEAARGAQRACNTELGYTTHDVLGDQACDTLHESLLAGDRLAFALRRLEHVYNEKNCREYELVKHVSLRLCFPAAFLQLQVTGRCEIEIPEWMFDMDYPGHYMRRIRSVAVTIPCVVGPYTGVHCRLTLTGSTTRIDPRLLLPRQPCCSHADRDRAGAVWSSRPCTCEACTGGYAAECDDSRFVRSYAASDAIATSSGQNDSGLFELSFRDERYLPFEFAGAVSRWRIELPPENNPFDFASKLTDCVLHLSHTAREGGGALRAAAERETRRRLPGDGLRLFDVRHDLSDAWQALHRADPNRKILPLHLDRHAFPFLVGAHEVEVEHIDIFLQLEGPDRPASQVVRYLSPWAEREPHDPDATRHDVVCITDAAWHGLYQGRLSLPRGRRAGLRDLGSLQFADGIGRIEQIYLLCSYRRKAGD